jgi:hypothetical protein
MILIQMNSIGRGALPTPPPTGGQSTSSQPPPSFLEMLSRASAQMPAAPSVFPPSSGSSGSQPATSGMPPVLPGTAAGQPVNVDNVARAIAEALGRLPPEQRADQFNVIRGMLLFHFCTYFCDYCASKV